jgi:hypothetical protein
MNYLRPILVPFQPASLLIVVLFAPLLSFFAGGGILGLFGAVILQIWVFKYCYVVLEQVADGAREPPVMSLDMLSPLETRPWMQLALVAGGLLLCQWLGGEQGEWLGFLLLLAFPASVALLGMGEGVFRAMNPLAWWRVARGLGPVYLVLLALLALVAFVFRAVADAGSRHAWQFAIVLLLQIAFFSWVGFAIWWRRRQLGFEPSRSPERLAARQEAERVRRREQMLDEVFQQVRLGKHVDATAPLARWLEDMDGEFVVRDGLHVAGRALEWKSLPALNPIGSTLIRHLLRFGHADTALAVYEMFRQRSPQFTMDSAQDLRILADHAESLGKDELAQSMRLETPVLHAR